MDAGVMVKGFVFADVFLVVIGINTRFFTAVRTRIVAPRPAPATGGELVKGRFVDIQS